MNVVISVRLILLATLAATSAAHAQNPALLARSKQLVSQIDQEAGARAPLQLDASASDETFGFGVLRTSLSEESAVQRVSNERVTGTGKIRERFYFDPEGQLVAKFDSDTAEEADRTYYREEWVYYLASAFYTSVSRQGEFAAGEAIDATKLEAFTTTASEIDERALKDLYETALNRCKKMAQVTRTFAGKSATLTLDHVLLDTLSPDGQYIVQRRPHEAEAERVLYELVKTADGQVLGRVYEGLPEGNHIDYRGHWSPSEDLFIFRFDAKWTTMAAPIYRVDREGLEALGDLSEEAQKAALAEVVRAKHPYAKHADGIHGFTNILSIEPDGRVHLILETESKVEGPETNVRTEMTLHYTKGSDVRATGRHLLGYEDSPVGITPKREETATPGKVPPPPPPPPPPSKGR